MACGSCLNKNKDFTAYYALQYQTPECLYNLETILDWKDKLFCVRDNGLSQQLNLTNQELNSYLGIVLSAVNMGDRLCFIREKLDTVQPIIINIINLGQC